MGSQGKSKSTPNTLLKGKGPEGLSSRSIQGESETIQCYNCGCGVTDGGNVPLRDTATGGSSAWTRSLKQQEALAQNSPKQSVKPVTPLNEADLYHNPDPLFRLIGTPNESELFVDGEKVTVLTDSGAQISSISTTSANTLKLKIKSLKPILDLKATGGSRVPY